MTDTLQKEYNSFIKDITKERTRIASIISATLIPASFVLDYFSVPSNFAPFLVTRLSCAAVSLVILRLLYTKVGQKFGSLLGYIQFLIVALAIAILIRFMGGYQTPYYAGLNLIILGGAVLMPWTFRESSYMFSIIYSFYLFPILLFDQIEDVSIFVSNNMFIIETMIIALASSYFTSRLRSREFSARLNLEQARDELKEIDELKNQFFSKVSHELRTPLTNIMLPIQNILAERGENINPENRKEKTAMLRNARKLMKQINQILDISKLEAGRMEIRPTLRNLNNILDDIMLASSISAKEMGIDLVFAPDTKLPEIYMDGDKIEKVFSNLISNALKFTGRGGKVEVNTKEEEGHIEVSVSDTGIGIATKQLPHIFDRFHQVDGSASRKYEGTGLGLFMVKEFLELHHGSVEVSSEVGQGTTFTVQLLKGKGHFRKEEIQEELKFETIDGFREHRRGDRRQGDRREGDRRQMAAEDRETIDSLQVQLSDLQQGTEYYEEAGKWGVETDQEKKSILVVEDNKDLASNIARSLADIYNVFIAYDGRQALDKVHQEMPDIIVSDVMMPEMDGYELCEKIKSGEQTQHIPVILLTAKATINDKIEGLKHGADQYLAKPFNPNELRATVDSLLTKRELQAELNKTNLELKKTLRELEETQVQLVHTARLESVGQLAAGMAHEIKNNIYCVRAGLDGINKRMTLLSEGKLDIKDTYKNIEKVMKTNDEAIESSLYVVNSLLAFSGRNKEGADFRDINEGIESTLTILLPRIKDKVTVHKEYGELKKVECRLEEINQVIMNLMLNAYQAIEEKGTIWVRTIPSADDVKISIADDGSGIPEGNLDKIFSPFFSTKEKELNTGLGLSICYNIIMAHHGTIDVTSTVGQGTEFIITLPNRQPKS